MPSDRLRRLVGAVLGLALLAEALPIAAAAIARLPGDAVLQDLRRGAPVPRAALDRVAGSRERALAWRERPADRAVLGLVHLLRADRAAGDPTAHLQAAASQLRRGLRGNPADPHAWVRLALAQARLGDAPAAAGALRMSERTGANVPELQQTRSALRHWLAASGAPGRQP